MRTKIQAYALCIYYGCAYVDKKIFKMPPLPEKQLMQKEVIGMKGKIIAIIWAILFIIGLFVILNNMQISRSIKMLLPSKEVPDLFAVVQPILPALPQQRPLPLLSRIVPSELKQTLYEFKKLSDFLCQHHQYNHKPRQRCHRRLLFPSGPG